MLEAKSVLCVLLSPEENMLKVGVEEFQELAQEILLAVTAAGQQRHQ